MNKFRIVEQRGVFRIQRKGVKQWFWRNLYYYTDPEQAKFTLDGEYMSQRYFDTYEKAENYIKNTYGSNGVDAIEKPEWKTV